MYGEGGAEEVVGEAIQGQPSCLCIVTKVYPHNASRKKLPESASAASNVSASIQLISGGRIFLSAVWFNRSLLPLSNPK
jgi:hypothetical protein